MFDTGLGSQKNRKKDILQPKLFYLGKIDGGTLVTSSKYWTTRQNMVIEDHEVFWPVQKKLINFYNIQIALFWLKTTWLMNYLQNHG